MKVALIGDGKTGQFVKGLIEKKDLVGPFNKDFLVEKNLETFRTADIGISFTVGKVMESLIPHILEANMPMIIGSTGLDFTKDLDQKLKDKKLTWVYASNFSLGVLIVRYLMDTLRKISPLLPNGELSIHEIHHIMKKDAPSGTALSLEKWLSPDKKIKITSSRVGDVVGTHEVILQTKSESIKIVHEAKNRTIFAQGAMEAALFLHQEKEKIPFGLIPFDELMKLKNGDTL